MSINHNGKYIEFECDECSEVSESFDNDPETGIAFTDIVGALKDEGWFFVRDDVTGEWVHLCPDCT